MNIIEKEYKHPEYLVDTAWLEKNLESPNLRIFDCTVHVTRNPDVIQRGKIPFVYNSGIDNFNDGHIPRAGYINVASDLSDPSSELPLMLPSEKQFLDTMRSCGVNNDSHVILYSASDPNWATRVWWMLQSFGFNNVAILNGGFKKWNSERRPLSPKSCEYPLGNFSLQLRPNSFADKFDVLNAIENKNVQIMCALPKDMYNGSSEFGFGRKGKIPSSVNVPFASLHDPDTGIYLSANQLHQKFTEVGIDKDKHIITYCGGGVAASNDAFALTLLGYENVSVYDGSMLEWGNDASLPIELETDQGK